MNRKPLLALSLVALLAGCQNYSFRQVKPLPLAIVNVHAAISAQHATPYIMIVQDTSYSMCEPIDRDAGLDGDAGDFGYAYCASDPTQSKMGLTASAMQTVLAGLDATKNPFYLGLTSFPGPGAGCNVVTAPIYPIGDARTTKPQISAWYQGIVSAEQGATPTAATLAGPVASDPAFQSPDAGDARYVLLITDGLPNCNNTNPCVYGSGSQYLWSDGVQHGCLSPTWLTAIGQGGPTPPPACSCALGACTNPDPNNGNTYRNDCCIVDWSVSPDGGYPLAPVAADECLDADDTVSVIASLKAQGITTYVVGMGYDFTNGAALDRMAQAGQNDPSAVHFQADNPDQLAKTLHDLIAFLAVSCNYPLDRTPRDPRLIDVVLDGTPLTLDAADGFSYATPGGVPTVIVTGSSCAIIKDGKNHDLTITALAN